MRFVSRSLFVRHLAVMLASCCPPPFAAAKQGEPGKTGFAHLSRGVREKAHAKELVRTAHAAFNQLSAKFRLLFVVASNAQHRNDLAFLIQKLRAQVLSMLKRIALLRPGCALVLLAVGAGTHAAPVTTAGFSHVKSLGGIDEYRFDANGLTVLLKRDHSAPVVTFQMTYRVGSRNEVTGTTGATHILEHLMFKGTEAFNDAKGNSVKQYLSRVGAGFNATTSIDRTNYFATLGRDHLDGYMAIEADRMRNLALRDADRQAEMTVVRNEYEQGENSPRNALLKEVMAAAYQAHPYHHSTIGWRSDIENLPTGKLREFYDTFYWPDNATAILVGDFEPAKALQLIKKHFGAIPRAPRPIPQVYTEEPPQTGARRVAVKRAGQLGSVLIAFKAPNGRHADLPALSVLGSILSTGNNSRFSKSLVDTSLALAASGGIAASHDPGLFMMSMTLAPGAKHADVEKIALAETEKVKREGVTAEEVAQVLNIYRAREAYGRDGTAGIASALNEAVALGDWTFFVTFIDNVSKVTPTDVQRVASAWLDEDQSTTGWFIPMVSQ